MVQRNETAMVELLKDSDQNAFEFLFRAYSTKIYRFSLGYLKCKEEAEEIVQDTFLKVWQTRTTLDAASSFSGFVFTIAHNLILNRIRKLRNQAVLRSQLSVNDFARCNSTEETVLLHELQQMRQSALSQLPPRKRIIFKLIREEQLSYQQVAEKLNISVKTVEAHMTEALKHFHRKLHL